MEAGTTRARPSRRPRPANHTAVHTAAARAAAVPSAGGVPRRAPRRNATGRSGRPPAAVAAGRVQGLWGSSSVCAAGATPGPHRVVARTRAAALRCASGRSSARPAQRDSLDARRRRALGGGLHPTRAYEPASIAAAAQRQAVDTLQQERSCSSGGCRPTRLHARLPQRRVAQAQQLHGSPPPPPDARGRLGLHRTSMVDERPHVGPQTPSPASPATARVGCTAFSL